MIDFVPNVSIGLEFTLKMYFIPLKEDLMMTKCGQKSMNNAVIAL